MKYKLIEASSPEELSKIVSKYLKDGEWKLYGNPIAQEKKMCESICVLQFYQAVVSTI